MARSNSCTQFDSQGKSVWEGRACTLNGMPARIVSPSTLLYRLVVETDDKSMHAEFTYSEVQRIMGRFRNRGQFFCTE